MTDYTSYVSKLTEIGFTKVCVVNKSFQVVGASAQDAVPAAWNETVTDLEGKSTTTLVNENQELQNDWAKVTKIKFFKMKFNKIQGDTNFIIGQNGPNILVCRMYPDCFIMAYGIKKSSDGKTGKF